MKNYKLTLAFSFLFLSFFNFSQSNTLVVFSQNPTPFYVVLDGVKKNEVAETRVVVPGIRQTNSNVQIFFKDESIAPISKNIWWDEAHKNDEVTFRIVPTKKGYKLRFFSTVPNKVTSTPSTQVAATPQTSQNVQSTTTTVVTETTTLNNNSNPNVGNVNMNTNMNTGMDVNGGNISMNINVNDGSNTSMGNENVNMSMNINVNEGNMNASDPMNGQMNVNMTVSDNMSSNSSNNISVNETITTTTTTTTTNETSSATGIGSTGGCINPIQNIDPVISAIENESFPEEKMIVAKQATSSKCLTVDQIKLIMNEFSFSESKLEFAKYAYKRCHNPDEYYQVNAAFDFSSEKEELNEYINSQN